MSTGPPLGLCDLRYRVEAALEYLTYRDVFSAEGVLVDLLGELNAAEDPAADEEETTWCAAQLPLAAQQRRRRGRAGRAASHLSLDEFVGAVEEGRRRSLASPATFCCRSGDVLVYGDGGTGKTTLMIDAACHWAAERRGSDAVEPADARAPGRE